MKRFYIDAFVGKGALGNPACVVQLSPDEHLADAQMLKIAADNGLPETAFVFPLTMTAASSAASASAAAPSAAAHVPATSAAGISPAALDPFASHDCIRLGLRWFTPDLEMDLCGHATLAAAFAMLNDSPQRRVVFSTREGLIEVIKIEAIKSYETCGSIMNNELRDVIKHDADNVEHGGGDVEHDNVGHGGGGVGHGDVTHGDFLYSIKFPVREGKPAKLPECIYNSLSIKPLEVYLSRDYHLVYASAQDILDMKIDREEFDKINLGEGGVVISAPGNNSQADRINAQADSIGSQVVGLQGGVLHNPEQRGVCDADFVSRFFTPQATILEDPVTGSAHCTLVPYWANRLHKRDLHARQLSERGGELFCRLGDDCVILNGRARFSE